jgi:hypothetical protein
MMANQKPHPDQDDELTGRAMQMLRDRIERSKSKEILDYLEVLIPQYEVAPSGPSDLAKPRHEYDWSEFMDFYGEAFIRNAYLCIVRREADAAALQAATQGLGADETSRIMFLGHLRYSQEGRGCATDVKGLWARYHYNLARAQNRRLRRWVFAVFLKLETLSRSRNEEALVTQLREMTAFRQEISKLEVRLAQHYNDTLKHVKREIAEALMPNDNR